MEKRVSDLEDKVFGELDKNEQYAKVGTKVKCIKKHITDYKKTNCSEQGHARRRHSFVMAHIR